jgi:type IV secretory pathway TraG/TraD family ATPase VirD4
VISNGLGERDVQRKQTSHSNSKTGSSTSTTWQNATEAAVLPSELMALPPLRGFLKFAGDYPIGKIRLIHRDIPARVKPFVER